MKFDFEPNRTGVTRRLYPIGTIHKGWRLLITKARHTCVKCGEKIKQGTGAWFSGGGDTNRRYQHQACGNIYNDAVETKPCPGQCGERIPKNAKACADCWAESGGTKGIFNK
jgi:hypothetical protein